MQQSNVVTFIGVIVAIFAAGIAYLSWKDGRELTVLEKAELLENRLIVFDRLKARQANVAPVLQELLDMGHDLSLLDIIGTSIGGFTIDDATTSNTYTLNFSRTSLQDLSIFNPSAPLNLEGAWIQTFYAFNWRSSGPGGVGGSVWDGGVIKHARLNLSGGESLQFKNCFIMDSTIVLAIGSRVSFERCIVENTSISMGPLAGFPIPLDIAEGPLAEVRVHESQFHEIDWLFETSQDERNPWKALMRTTEGDVLRPGFDPGTRRAKDRKSKDERIFVAATDSCVQADVIGGMLGNDACYIDHNERYSGTLKPTSIDSRIACARAATSPESAKKCFAHDVYFHPVSLYGTCCQDEALLQLYEFNENYSPPENIEIALKISKTNPEDR